MPDVYLSRINRWVEKSLNIKGGPTTVDLESAVRVILPVPIDVDQRYLMGWDLFGAAAAAIAAVGNVSGFRIRNPPGSNVIGVITRILYNVNPQAAVNMTISNSITVDLGTPMTGQKLDRRIIRANSALFVSQQSSSATITTGNTILTTNPATLVNQELIQDPTMSIPLLPGDSLDLITASTNVGLGLGFWWMERPLESSELT